MTRARDQERILRETAAARGQRVREALLAAAAELIGEHGWTGVSTRLVARRAGVAPGLVHYHFASLPALLHAAAVGAIRALLAGIGPLLEGAATSADLLDRLLGALDRFTGRDPTSLLITEAYLAATRDADLRADVAALVLDFRRDLAAALRQRGVPDAEATSAVLAAAVDGLILHRALDPDITAALTGPVLRRLLTAPDGKTEPRRRRGT